MKKIILIICIFVFLTSCSTTSSGKIPEDSQGIPDVCGCRIPPKGSSNYNK